MFEMVRQLSIVIKSIKILKEQILLYSFFGFLVLLSSVVILYNVINFEVKESSETSINQPDSTPETDSEIFELLVLDPWWNDENMLVVSFYEDKTCSIQREFNESLEYSYVLEGKKISISDSKRDVLIDWTIISLSSDSLIVLNSEGLRMEFDN